MNSIPGAGRFVMALTIFAIVYWMLPEDARPWFALIIVLGAVSYGQNIDVIGKAQEALG